MGCSESILLALAFHNVRLHIFPISEIEGDRPINLLEAQGRIVTEWPPETPRAEIPARCGTTPDQVEALMPAFNEFLAHASSIPPKRRAKILPACGISFLKLGCEDAEDLAA